jgi:hypothetical protein
MIAKNDLETAKEVYDILQKEKLSTDGRRRAYLLRAGFDDVQIRTILQAKRH